MNVEEQRWFTLPLVDSQNKNPRRNHPDYEEAIGQLNSLLRGEISAVEAYRMAINKLLVDGQDPDRVAMLRDLQRSHIRSEKIYRKRILELGGVCQDSSGSWGTKIAMGAARLFGDSAALHALRDSEEHELKEMQSSLVNLDADSAELVEKAMIPQQTKHIRQVTSLISVINS